MSGHLNCPGDGCGYCEARIDAAEFDAQHGTGEDES